MKYRMHLGAALLVSALTGCNTPPAEPPAPAAPPPVARPSASRPAAPAGSGAAPSGASASTGAGTSGAAAPATASGASLPPKLSASETLLKEGIAAFDNGDFGQAIRKLNTPELLDNGPSEIRLSARKYLAFSYCVSGRRAQCRQQFDLALKSSPGFDLSPAEAGHPIWGPVFKQAKAASRARK